MERVELTLLTQQGLLGELFASLALGGSSLFGLVSGGILGRSAGLAGRTARTLAAIIALRRQIDLGQLYRTGSSRTGCATITGWPSRTGRTIVSGASRTGRTVIGATSRTRSAVATWARATPRFTAGIAVFRRNRNLDPSQDAGLCGTGPGRLGWGRSRPMP